MDFDVHNKRPLGSARPAAPTALRDLISLAMGLHERLSAIETRTGAASWVDRSEIASTLQQLAQSGGSGIESKIEDRLAALERAIEQLPPPRSRSPRGGVSQTRQHPLKPIGSPETADRAHPCGEPGCQQRRRHGGSASLGQLSPAERANGSLAPRRAARRSPTGGDWPCRAGATVSGNHGNGNSVRLVPADAATIDYERRLARQAVEQAAAAHLRQHGVKLLERLPPRQAAVLARKLEWLAKEYPDAGS